MFLSSFYKFKYVNVYDVMSFKEEYGILLNIYLFIFHLYYMYLIKNLKHIFSYFLIIIYLNHTIINYK